MKNRIAQVVVGLPIEGPFDYALAPAMIPRATIGARVLVLFNRSKRVGYITGFIGHSKFKKLNTVIALLDEGAPSLDERALHFTKAFRDHYGCSWGEAIETYLPAALRERSTTSLRLASEPALETRPPQKILLHDHGLNKRWEHLTRMIDERLKKQQSVIFLVPEKTYFATIQAHLQPFKEFICVLESEVSRSEEAARWQRLKQEGPFLVLGTRSAIFCALAKCGLIIIYEEENSAYKQDQSPHYHVNDVALIRSTIEGVDVMIVSSCPSAEIVHTAQGKGWSTITLEDKLPAVQLIDMKNYNPKQTSRLSYPLQNRMFELLKTNGRSILYMNRRGFSTLTRCNQCGFTLKCPHCDVSLTYMYTDKKLHCRHCTYITALPKICPKCNSAYLRSVGIGIEKLESEVARYYPQAKVAHYDKETAVVPSTANMVLATQALMKQRAQYRADLSAILSFDELLNHADFRSAQRAFATAVHLAQMTKERLIVQSRNPDDYCLKALVKWDFKGFYKEELKLRKELAYPPFVHLLLILIRGKDEGIVQAQAQALYGLIKKAEVKNIEVLEPNQDFMPKLRDQYRYTIMLKAKKITPMLKVAKVAIKELKKKSVLITLNVDP